MGFFGKLKGWFGMFFAAKAKEEFGVIPTSGVELERFLELCARIYRGNPDWLDDNGHITTVNFAKTVASETARLATMNISVNLGTSPRAEYMQGLFDKTVMKNIRKWTEYGCGFGTVILKPNGNGVDVYTPADFIVTDDSNGDITGVVFCNSKYDKETKRWFTRLEYHRFADGKYIITNRCYVGYSKTAATERISIDDTPWAGLAEEVEAENVTAPLFGVFKTPAANNIEIESALGLPVFADAVQELRDLDIAYSRNAKEIFDSKRTVLLDSDRLLATGGKVGNANKTKLVEDAGLPDFVRAVEGTTGDGDIYHEINPTLNTDERISGINNLLSQIGFKCGFSNGYFVFNEKTGMVTATQVEADDRRTLQTIKDVRVAIRSCMDELIYAINCFEDAYGNAPRGDVEPTYNFADITDNVEEDRARWWGYVINGKVPAYKYFMKFEGMTEEEAKAMVEEAQGVPPLFGEEE